VYPPVKASHPCARKKAQGWGTVSGYTDFGFALISDAHFLFVRAGINPGDAEGSGNFGVAGGSALADAELKGSDGSWLDDHIEREGAGQ